MTFSEFTKHFAEGIGGIEPKVLTPETPLTSLANWDSMGVLTTIAWVDEVCGVQLSGETIHRCQNVGELWNLVEVTANHANEHESSRLKL